MQSLRPVHDQALMLRASPLIQVPILNDALPDRNVLLRPLVVRIKNELDLGRVLRVADRVRVGVDCVPVDRVRRVDGALALRFQDRIVDAVLAQLVDHYEMLFLGVAVRQCRYHLHLYLEVAGRHANFGIILRAFDLDQAGTLVAIGSLSFLLASQLIPH